MALFTTLFSYLSKYGHDLSISRTHGVVIACTPYKCILSVLQINVKFGNIALNIIGYS